MKRLKTIQILVFTFVIFTSIFLSSVSAQYFSFKIPNPSTIDSLEELLMLVTSVFRIVLLLTFMGLIMLAGYDMMTSRGSEDKIIKSKRTIAAAIVGFMIAVLAPTITNFILNLLGVEGLE